MLTLIDLRIRDFIQVSGLLRKEVIQPHLPIRLPCYDFTLITTPTFGRALLTVRLRTAVDKTEEGGDDVKSSCPLWPGLHTYYNGSHTEGSKIARWSKSLKAVPVQIAGCNPPA